MIRNSIAVSLGAIAGALSRYHLTLWFAQTYGTNFPYGTFVINLTGCVGMGLIATLAASRFAGISPELQLLIMTGFLGAYTTFSTYGLDTVSLLSRANWLGATIYWLGSATLGVVGIYLGIFLARLVDVGSG